LSALTIRFVDGEVIPRVCQVRPPPDARERPLRGAKRTYGLLTMSAQYLKPTLGSEARTYRTDGVRHS